MNAIKERIAIRIKDIKDDDTFIAVILHPAFKYLKHEINEKEFKHLAAIAVDKPNIFSGKSGEKAWYYFQASIYELILNLLVDQGLLELDE